MPRLALLSLALAFLMTATASAQPISAASARHIAEIENGLTPAVIIAGRPLPASSLIAHMRETGTPAVSIAFFENGRIVWTKAWGLADVASGRPAAPDTLFQAGSISKSVTAAGALRLVQDGVLDLDQDVNARLTGWKVPDTSFTAKRPVTLRALLSHTAGLTVHGYNGYAPGAPLPSLVQILNGAPPANSAPVVSSFAPGETWAYSGGGYVVTQLLMTETTGEPFPALLQRLVLGPAGMTHSSFEQPPAAFAPLLATGYHSAAQAVPGGHALYPEMAPAGLWTTPSDLARFAIAIQRSVAGAPRPLLGPAAAGAMMTRTLNNWGLGVDLGPPASPPHFQHSGDDQGFTADLVAFTSGRRQGVAIMTNTDNSGIAADVERAVAKSYGWTIDQPRVIHLADVPAATLADYAGAYDIPGLATLMVKTDAGRLYVTAPLISPQTYELLPETQTRFRILDPEVVGEFHRGRDGAVDRIDLTGALGDRQAVRKR